PDQCCVSGPAGIYKAALPSGKGGHTVDPASRKRPPGRSRPHVPPGGGSRSCPGWRYSEGRAFLSALRWAYRKTAAWSGKDGHIREWEQCYLPLQILHI